MTDVTRTAEPSRFRVGLVFNRSFALLFGDFAKFVGLAAILPLPWLMLSLFGAARMPGTLQSPFRPGTIGALAFILIVASSMLTQAVIFYGAFQSMRGQRFAIGDSLKYGLARFFPLVGLLIVMMLGFALAAFVCALPAGILAGVLTVALHSRAPGTVLVILPLFMIPAGVGVAILYVMWAVALPVCVIEHGGPGTSLGRSRALTKGHRWRIFAILLLVFIVNAVVQVVLARVLGALAGPTVGALGVFLWIAVAGAFGAIIIAVIYHDLRVAKDGIDIHRIAAVFD